MEQKLSYGSIIQLKTTIDKYKDQYFFVDKVNESHIELISSVGMKQESLLFDSHFHMWRDLDGMQIDEILVVLYQTQGYAKLNDLIQGKYVNVEFISGETIEGYITQQEKDMIVIDDVYYIDFKYCGLLDEYQIQTIEAKVPPSKEKKKDSVSQETNDIQEDVYIFTYDIQQQIQDYVDKTSKKGNTFIIQNEVKKYCQLLDVKASHKHPLHHNFLYLNNAFFYPSSKNIDEVKYSDENIFLQVQENHVIFESNASIFEDFSLTDMLKTTHNMDQMMIKPINDTRVLRIYHEDDSFLPLYQLRTISQDERTKNLHKMPECYFVEEHIPQGKVFAPSGIVFHEKQKIMENLNLQKSESLLSKAVQNIHIRNKTNVNIKMFDPESSSLFEPNQKVFVPFPSLHDKWNHAMYQLPFTLQKMYATIKQQFHISVYDFVQCLGIFDANPVHQKDMSWIIQYMRKYVEQMKTKIQQKNRSLRKIKYTSFVNNASNELQSLLCEHYNIVSQESSHIGEIFQQHYRDFGHVLMHFLKDQSHQLQIPFGDDDVQEIVENMKQELETKQTNDKSNANQLAKQHVKTYHNMQELNDDSGKIILKDVENDAFQNQIQYLHSLLQTQHSYTESIEVFNTKLQKILASKPQDYNEESIGKMKEELFGSIADPLRTDLFVTLQNEIIRLQVRQNDKCFVKDEKKYYLYDGTNWVSMDQHQEKMKAKKVLRFKNSSNEFDNIKTDMYNEFALQLLRDIQNEKMIDLEKRQMKQMALDYKQVREHLVRINIRNVYDILKYNLHKLEKQSTFDLQSYLGKIKVSPNIGIMYKILGVDNDLHRKYTLINQFVALLTEDNQDPHWYMCASNQTKLMPKFLHTLALAYFNGTHESTIKQICIKEGTLSENGDAWVHKHTGIVIQQIQFDTNYGYDSNGFKITLDAVFEKENTSLDETEIMKETLDEIMEDNTYEIKKVLVLSPKEKEVYHITASVMNLLGMKVFQESDYGHIKTIYEIYQKSIKREKNVENKKVYFMYSIITFLLTYIQCHTILIKKTFPGCISDFSGFPLDSNKKHIKGIQFFSCLLETLSKKNTNPPYSLFRKKKASETAEELMKFAKTHTIKNTNIASMIETKRHTIILQKNKLVAPDESLLTFSQFKPCLQSFVTIQALEKYPEYTKQKGTYAHYDYIHDRVSYVNMRLQEFLQDQIAKETPLLKSHSFEEPFLVNFCCNQSEYITKHLCKTKELEKEFSDIMKQSDTLSLLMDQMEALYFNKPTIRFGSEQIPSTTINDNVLQSVDEQNIYAFMIKYGNFDNDRNIQEFLKPMIPKKPNVDTYNKNDTMEKKIQNLKDTGYVFTQESLVEALLLYHKQMIFHETTTPSSQEQIIFIQTFEDMTTYSVEELDAKSMEYRDKVITFSKLKGLFGPYMEKIIDLLNGFDKDQNKESIVSFLERLNEALFCVIPKKMLNGYFGTYKSIKNKHWHLDPIHFQTIESHLNQNDRYFKDITLHEFTTDFLNKIMASSGILDHKIVPFRMVQRFAFHQCVFYKLMHYYSMCDLENSRVANKKNIHDINTKLYEYIIYLKKYHLPSYEDLAQHHKRLKQSEKKIKTDSLSKKSKVEREVEKYKMNAKLGEWSYGLNKQMRIYDADHYQDETQRANDVKDMYLNQFGAQAAQDLIQSEDSLQDLDLDLDLMEDDEHVNEHGSILEDYDN